MKIFWISIRFGISWIIYGLSWIIYCLLYIKHRTCSHPSLGIRKDSFKPSRYEQALKFGRLKILHISGSQLDRYGRLCNLFPYKIFLENVNVIPFIFSCKICRFLIFSYVRHDYTQLTIDIDVKRKVVVFSPHANLVVFSPMQIYNFFHVLY